MTTAPYSPNPYLWNGKHRWSEACAEVCGVPRVRDMSLVAADPESQGAGVAYFSNFKPGPQDYDHHQDQQYRHYRYTIALAR